MLRAIFIRPGHNNNTGLTEFTTATDLLRLIRPLNDQDLSLAGLCTYGLDRQMAVLLYDDDAAERGELLNSTVLEMLPDSFISPSGRTLVYGNAIIAGFRDRSGLWTSVPHDLITQLVWANRFQVEVRPTPQSPWEQAGPAYDSRSAALQARDRWRNAILDREIDGAEVTVRAEIGEIPPPATDVSLEHITQTVDRWCDGAQAKSPQPATADPSAEHQPRPGRSWWSSLPGRLLEAVRRR